MPRNVRFDLATRLVTPDLQAQLLEQLAIMHARWWQSPKLKDLPNFSQIWAGADRVVMAMLRPEYWDMCMAKERCREITGPYADRERVKEALRTNWRRALEIPQCFSHGDAHLGNMFFNPDGSPGMLDWQAWQEGPYMHDVAYSTIGNLAVEDRRKHEKDLIAGYLDGLKRHGIANPPSREEARYACAARGGTGSADRPYRIQGNKGWG